MEENLTLYRELFFFFFGQDVLLLWYLSFDLKKIFNIKKAEVIIMNICVTL